MTAAELTDAVGMLRAAEVARAAVERWGVEPQLRQTQEECAELIAAINRYTRGRDPEREHLLEEAGQVFVMLLQVREFVGHDAFARAVRAAADKTARKLVQS
jgi:NTP pyrophosphatase (non-canonical NTP hydrolase)